jgi:hypothetical protein
MKIVVNKLGAIAISPRDVVYFKADETLTVGDKGLSEDNLKRLIELGFADGIAEDDGAAPVADIVVSDEIAPVVIPDAYDFEAITDKAELAIYALEIYSIELDKRKSLEKMIDDLKNAIKGDK